MPSHDATMQASPRQLPEFYLMFLHSCHEHSLKGLQVAAWSSLRLSCHWSQALRCAHHSSTCHHKCIPTAQFHDSCQKSCATSHATCRNTVDAGHLPPLHNSNSPPHRRWKPQWPWHPLGSLQRNRGRHDHRVILHRGNLRMMTPLNRHHLLTLTQTQIQRQVQGHFQSRAQSRTQMLQVEPCTH